jgi:fructose-1,6-bisphosphatase/inositol monophosphatase family enzyme
MIEVIADELKSIADEVLAPWLSDRTALRHGRKAGGEPVSQVDLTMEARLRRFLRSFFPYVSIVGEESAGAAAALGHGLGEGTVWLIDPLDGTGNFLAGGEDFAVMLCRLLNGTAVTAWIYLPARGLVAMAEAGGGAMVDGVRIRPPTAWIPPRMPAEMAGEVHAGFLPEGLKARIAAARSHQPGRRPRFCAGATYVSMAQRECDYALYYRTRPWDHAPGALLVAETGGRAARFDGAPYCPADGGSGLLVTRGAQDWEPLQRFLLGQWQRPGDMRGG